MHLPFALLGLLYSLDAFALVRKYPARIAATPHVLPLQATQFRREFKHSSAYLHKRSGRTPALDLAARQDDDGSAEADIQHELATIGGRVYMTNLNLSYEPYTLVIDTGSSDTWVASSAFRCVSLLDRTQLDQSECGFGKFYDPAEAGTYRSVQGYPFEVNYTDGEFLRGELGMEYLELAGLVERQVIGVVDEGWWMGDGASSGLIGLAYPHIASNAQQLNYSSVMFNILSDADIPPTFSLALTRPTRETPTSGGLIAFGGIPDVEHDRDFVTVTIRPITDDIYAFYSIPVDGFVVLPANGEETVEPNSTLNFTNFPIPAIVDSGSTLMYLPDQLADHIASLFSPPAMMSTISGMWMTNCGATPPRIGVIIGGKTFWIDPRDLINNETVGGGVRLTGSCAISVQRMVSGDAVLGDAFLKNVVAVFDLEDNEMEFSGRTAQPGSVPAERK